MMDSRLLVVIILFVCAQHTCAQELKPDTTTNKIVLYELWGDYENMQHAFDIRKHTHSKSTGQLSDKTISLPVLGPGADFIRIGSDGAFLHPRYPNAKWSIRNGTFVIITQFNQIIPSYLHRDDLTHLYKITVEGETYSKKR